MTSRCRTSAPRCYLVLVPTTRPRYTVTDTGHVAEMLDAAQREWPEVEDRRQLLMKLAELGSQHVEHRLTREEARARAERQRAAMREIRDMIDVEVLLSDEAWR